MDVELTAEEIDNFQREQYQKVKWNYEEAATILYRSRLEKIFFNYSLPFSDALVWVLKTSIFGPFLDVLNPGQNNKYLNENKFSVVDYEVRNMSKSQREHFNRKNQIFNNMYGCLKYMVNEGLAITIENLQQILKVLRISNCYTNLIDAGLKDFKNLQILILSGNNLREIKGSYLPKNLKFLELNNNFLTDLKLLAENPPKSLLYLGLRRNCLKDNSSLQLLKNIRKLSNLDLSDNDICGLDTTLQVISSLRYLSSLHLNGNPCSLDPFYINRVCANFEKLDYLDNTQILQEDKDKPIVLDDSVIPQLIFQCYRVMGLPKPPTLKNTKFKQTIHVEVTLPLLEIPKLPKPDIKTPTSICSHAYKVSSKLRMSSTRSTQSGINVSRVSSKHQKSSKSAKSRVDKPLNIYEQTDEYDIKLEAKNFSFKSIRMPWNQIIEYPKITIKIPTHDPFLLRDTLRSAVKVDIIYLLVAPIGSLAPKSDGSRKGVRLDIAKEECNEKETGHSEDVLSKITVGSFYCHLEPWNWSDEYLDFYWTNDPSIGNKAVKVEGCLKDLNYGDKGKKSDEIDNTSQSIPKNLSCHVGFAIPRDLFCAPRVASLIPSGIAKSHRGTHISQFTPSNYNIP